MIVKKLGKFFGYGIAIIIIFSGIYFFVAEGSFLKERQDASFGVTFSTVMARQLGLDPREVFDALVDDLRIKKMRIPVYWSDIEPERGVFDFSDYDYLIEKSEDRNIELILIVGRKLPRWPECFRPAWSEKLTEKEFEERMDNQIRVIVERYKGSSSVTMWQVENEPFHVFGADCAKGKIKTENVDREIALVRSLDSDRPIMLTDAGKAGTWSTSLKRVEVLGVTMYYQVWNPRRGVVWSTFGPGLFWAKSKILQPFFADKKIIVAELQAEPYGPVLLPDYAIDFQLQLMNIGRFRETIRRARKAGFSENYLWGVEWWYWLKENQSNDSFWEEARRLF
jgi:hypothetical protein